MTAGERLLGRIETGLGLADLLLDEIDGEHIGDAVLGTGGGAGNQGLQYSEHGLLPSAAALIERRS